MCHHNLAPKSACLGAISGSKANNLHYMSINTLMQVNVEAPSECVCTVCVAQRSPRLGMQHRVAALLTPYINCMYKVLSMYKFAAKTVQVWLSKPPLDFGYVGRVQLE